MRHLKQTTGYATTGVDNLKGVVGGFYGDTPPPLSLPETGEPVTESNAGNVTTRRGNEAMRTKRLFTVKQAIATLLVGLDANNVKLTRPLTAPVIQGLLAQTLGLRASLSRIREIIQELRREGIIEKKVYNRPVKDPGRSIPVSWFRVTNFDRAFEDIEEDRIELKRHRDSKRQRKHRKSNKKRRRGTRGR